MDMSVRAIENSEWIPIGRAEQAEELERMIQALKARWARRYHYRIQRAATSDDIADYELYLRHR